MTRVQRLKKRERTRKLRTFALVILIVVIVVLVAFNLFAVLFPRLKAPAAEVKIDRIPSDGYFGSDELDWGDYYEDDYDELYEYEMEGETNEDSQWKLGIDVSWTEELSEGYEIDVNMKIWEPIRLNESCLHPGDQLNRVYPYPGYDGENAWIIPYVVTATNKTVGYGPAKGKFGLSAFDVSNTRTIGKIDNYDGIPAFVIWGEGRGAGQYEANTFRPHGVSYFRLEKDVQVDCFSPEIQEGETWKSAGCCIYVDSRKTPEKPNGREPERFFYRSGKNSLIITSARALGKWGSSGNYECRRIVALEKDPYGNVVFGKEYDIETGEPRVYTRYEN